MKQVQQAAEAVLGQLETVVFGKRPILVGEKGSFWCTLRVHGTPGHASQPFRTDNALVTAAEVVRRLARRQRQVQRVAMPEPVQSLGCRLPGAPSPAPDIGLNTASAFLRMMTATQEKAMPKFVIERELKGAGKLPKAEPVKAGMIHPKAPPMAPRVDTGAKLGAQVGTTSLAFINEVIDPATEAKVYDTTNDVKSALEAGQILVPAREKGRARLTQSQPGVAARHGHDPVDAATLRRAALFGGGEPEGDADDAAPTGHHDRDDGNEHGKPFRQDHATSLH